MGEFNVQIENLNFYKDAILSKWKEDIHFVSKLDSYSLFKLISFFYEEEEGEKLVNRDIDQILQVATESFNLFDVFSILILKKNKIQLEKINDNFFECLKEHVSSKTLIFINKILNQVLQLENEKIKFERADIYNLLFNNLKELPSEISSIHLFDMTRVFLDFTKELEKRYNSVYLLIDKYQKYDPDVLGTKIFKGSTIVGKLIQDENQFIAKEYIDLLKQESNTDEMQMIGGGGSCLVYKIGKYVLKFGETRISRKIYINHRILASQKRKLHVDKNNNPLFYAEIMKYVETKGITIEDLEELKSDLARQGLIWDDAKIDNCGILDIDDENISNLPVDYVEVAGNINNPDDREEFQKRKRKVVVIDNDAIRFDTRKSCR